MALTELNTTKLILKSSNENKIKEFKRILGNTLSIKPGKDLPEIDSDSLNVVIHKAKDAGENIIVEDTTLTIDGQEIVDIKWKINELKKINKTPKAIWRVLLGVLQNNQIYVFEGIIKGKIVVPKNEIEGFGFDPYFVPNGTDLSLAELDKKGQKENYSARKKALLNLISNKPLKVINSSNIKKWEGKYQNS